MGAAEVDRLFRCFQSEPCPQCLSQCVDGFADMYARALRFKRLIGECIECCLYPYQKQLLLFGDCMDDRIQFLRRFAIGKWKLLFHTRSFIVLRNRSSDSGFHQVFLHCFLRCFFDCRHVRAALQSQLLNFCELAVQLAFSR